ncbi:MAG: hypothetical protein ACRCWQ_03315 [Bacilli bacterium]
MKKLRCVLTNNIHQSPESVDILHKLNRNSEKYTSELLAIHLSDVYQNIQQLNWEAYPNICTLKPEVLHEMLVRCYETGCSKPNMFTVASNVAVLNQRDSQCVHDMFMHQFVDGTKVSVFSLYEPVDLLQTQKYNYTFLEPLALMQQLIRFAKIAESDFIFLISYLSQEHTEFLSKHSIGIDLIIVPTQRNGCISSVGLSSVPILSTEKIGEFVFVKDDQRKPLNFMIKHYE